MEIMARSGRLSHPPVHVSRAGRMSDAHVFVEELGTALDDVRSID